MLLLLFLLLTIGPLQALLALKYWTSNGRYKNSTRQHETFLQATAATKRYNEQMLRANTCGMQTRKGTPKHWQNAFKRHVLPPKSSIENRTPNRAMGWNE